LAALADLALDLLARNYAVGPDAMRHLFRLARPDAPGREANDAMWAAIAEAVLGRPPKPSPVG
jgi:hypothetical protein